MEWVDKSLRFRNEDLENFWWKIWNCNRFRNEHWILIVKFWTVLSQFVLNSFVVIFSLMNSKFSSPQFDPILIIRNYDTEKETSFIFSPCVGGLKLTKPSESGETTSCILDSIKNWRRFQYAICFNWNFSRQIGATLFTFLAVIASRRNKWNCVIKINKLKTVLELHWPKRNKGKRQSYCKTDKIIMKTKCQNIV